ncbi:hypothetical protein [Marinobacter sp. C2H3]|uniref:hypothetical protein n=1 Tax=Marinobacter sp. C2H3 TaxID=3119003 RepID=UPI00300E8302
MCNAWNHPPECRCGLGGEGHAVKRQVGSSYNQWVPPLDLSRESFTRPNTSCPVCGASVFFYQSPDNGWVFFDDLGPPWPKHPCTDSRAIPARLTVEKRKLPEYCPAWEYEGWCPIQLRYDSEVDKFFSRLHLIMDGVETNLYFRKSALTRYGRTVPIEAYLPAHVRETRENVYELSMLDTFARPVQFFALRTWLWLGKESRFRSESPGERKLNSSLHPQRPRNSNLNESAVLARVANNLSDLCRLGMTRLKQKRALAAPQSPDLYPPETGKKIAIKNPADDQTG